MFSHVIDPKERFELNKVIKKLSSSTDMEQLRQVPTIPPSYVVSCPGAAVLLRHALKTVRGGWDKFDHETKELFVSYISFVKKQSGLQNCLKKIIENFLIAYSEEIQRSQNNAKKGQNFEGYLAEKHSYKKTAREDEKA